MTEQTDLADRYGAVAPWRRRTLLALVVVLVVAFAGWLTWTVWAASNPDVTSELVGFDVVDEHRALARVDVALDDGDVVATCTLRAYAEDHAVVGELTFAPVGSGRTEQTIRTERLATSVELLGCSTADQQRPR